MANVAGLVGSLTKLQVQEQAEDSSGAPPDYEGRVALDPILLDVERLVVALETGGVTNWHFSRSFHLLFYCINTCYYSLKPYFKHNPTLLTIYSVVLLCFRPSRKSKHSNLSFPPHSF